MAPLAGVADLMRASAARRARVAPAGGNSPGTGPALRRRRLLVGGLIGCGRLGVGLAPQPRGLERAVAADLPGRSVELLRQQRIGLAEAPRDAADRLAQLLAQLRRGGGLLARGAQELLRLGTRGALDLAPLATAFGHRAIMRGLRVGELALRFPARALEHAARLRLGVLADLGARRESSLLALLDERVGACLRALERVLGFRSDAIGLGALRCGAIALGLRLAHQHADLLALRLRRAHRAGGLVALAGERGSFGLGLVEQLLRCRPI